MWRPFACNFVTHAFDNFLKKAERAESAPLSTKREILEERSYRNKSVKTISEEAEQKILEFQNLKKKVRQQRESIKQIDENAKRSSEIRLKMLKEAQVKARERKKQEMIRIRNMLNSKPPRSKTSTSVRGRQSRVTESSQQSSTIFGLTAPSEEKSYKRGKTPLPRIKNRYPDENSQRLKTIKEITSKDFIQKSHFENKKTKEFLAKKPPPLNNQNITRALKIVENFRLAPINYKLS
ncbi:hypothetical protein SteCoe_30050 [Stentor coeruleus]|uniref:Uncharacterized protein n=1 Tax=Stentor coeruleus TaxID=5963 RepID=A0A1R2B4G6_9CILI|nr:hypothetical protein SteCoe_30050 [Stentor coeruleus]